MVRYRSYTVDDNVKIWPYQLWTVVVEYNGALVLVKVALKWVMSSLLVKSSPSLKLHESTVYVLLRGIDKQHECTNLAVRLLIRFS